ncbi:Inosine-5'-monophosphate dehydrogenase 2 [Linum perenne]
MVGAAIGASEKRLEEFVKAGADVVVLDHITDWNEKIEMIKLVKQSYPGLDVVCGDVLTVNQARRLIAAGVDGLRVGIGRAQASAVYKIGRVAAQSGVPVMAYGNWKEAAVGAHNNIVKALVLGSSTVITENIIEQTLEEFIIPYTLQVVKQGFHYLGASSLNSAHHLLRSHSLRLELRTPSSQEEIRRRDKLMGDKSSLHY